MIEVFRVPVSKAQLRAIPADERNLLLLASHAVNQISVLRRLVIFSSNYQSSSELENTLSAGQTQTILRFLFGALAEAWEMIKRPVNQKLIGTDYIQKH
jgi:CRISPR/Cas system-associated protein endoribonuclease Cas2